MAEPALSNGFLYRDAMKVNIANAFIGDIHSAWTVLSDLGLLPRSRYNCYRLGTTWRLARVYKGRMRWSVLELTIFHGL